ncbi:MAG: prepilin-type N-terminal cleavage/methylation domain-containing protein, partial [Syntrophomonadaceae bacterium]|nr:prepilin-type N-terminal cleavage/methylation domain-containing protein [Syntrophomonadaceae bacterium]
MMWIRRDREKEKGFTLVELIVVMAILAILAALALPRFANVLDNAEKKADEANRAMIQQAIDLYIVNERQAPEKLDDLKTKNYLREIPRKPDGGTYDLDDFD